jgi:hypothetical protein
MLNLAIRRQPMNERAIKKRRYFRFRLRTLLLLPILVAAVWWWWTWPERDLLNARDIEGAKAMIVGAQPSAGFWKIVASGKFSFDPPVFQPATRRDYLAARRTFHFDWRWDSESRPLGPFLANRNRIMLSTSASTTGVRLFISLKNDAPEALAQSLGPLYPEYRFDADEENNRVILRIPDSAFSEISALMLLFKSEQPL